MTDLLDDSKTPTEKLPEKKKPHEDHVARQEREERQAEHDKRTQEDHEATVAMKLALAKAAEAQASFYSGAANLVPLAEQFFKTKTPEVIESFKKELSAQLNFSIANVLYRAGLVDAELVDQMARQTHVAQPAQDVPDAAQSVLGNFDPSKFGAPKPIM